LDESYKKKMGQGIQFADLGRSTEKFNFFVTQSISRTLTLTAGKSSSKDGGMSLMNKMINLTTEGKYSLIETVVDKLTKKQEAKKTEKKEKKKEPAQADDWVSVLSKTRHQDTQKFAPIKEEDEILEEEALEEIKKEEERERAEKGEVVEEEEKEEKQIVTLPIKKLPTKLTPKIA
jgi:hypothetical protein